MRNILLLIFENILKMKWFYSDIHSGRTQRRCTQIDWLLCCLLTSPRICVREFCWSAAFTCFLFSRCEMALPLAEELSLQFLSEKGNWVVYLSAGFRKSVDWELPTHEKSCSQDSQHTVYFATYRVFLNTQPPSLNLQILRMKMANTSDLGFFELGYPFAINKKVHFALNKNDYRWMGRHVHILVHFLPSAKKPQKYNTTADISPLPPRHRQRVPWLRESRFKTCCLQFKPQNWSLKYIKYRVLSVPGE